MTDRNAAIRRRRYRCSRCWRESLWQHADLEFIEYRHDGCGGFWESVKRLAR